MGKDYFWFHYSPPSLVEHAVEQYGRIDTWVHAAAVSIYAPFQETKPDEFRRVTEINLIGPAFGAMTALPHLKGTGVFAGLGLILLKQHKSCCSHWQNGT